jgi:hypothetical protein
MEKKEIGMQSATNAMADLHDAGRMINIHTQRKI